MKTTVNQMLFIGAILIAQCGHAQSKDEQNPPQEITLTALSKPSYEESIATVPANMTVQQKKDRFYRLLLPPIQKVHRELQALFESVKSRLETGNREDIAALKSDYRVETDQELLMAIKPHPVSIVLAQAAMESSWATSRFIREANNAFGIWSFKPSEPRIAARGTRGKQKVFLKKYASLEESVRDNYNLIAKGRAYAEFRKLRMQTEDPHTLVKELDAYSEIGERYARDLSSIIRFNKFTRYDKV